MSLFLFTFHFLTDKITIIVSKKRYNTLKQNKKRRNPIAAICSVLGTTLLILIIVVCIPLTVPRLIGYQIYSVVTGSMEPEIPVGSMVYVKSIVPKEIKERDVIAFYGGRDVNAIITHRVVDNNEISGQIITKGDANKTEDMNPVSYSEVIGKVEYTIPKAGELAQLFTSSQGKIMAASMVGLAVVLHVIASIIETKK